MTVIFLLALIVADESPVVKPTAKQIRNGTAAKVQPKPASSPALVRKAEPKEAIAKAGGRNNEAGYRIYLQWKKEQEAYNEQLVAWRAEAKSKFDQLPEAEQTRDPGSRPKFLMTKEGYQADVLWALQHSAFTNAKKKQWEQDFNRDETIKNAFGEKKQKGKK